jgi:hypothetical protein
MLFKVLKGFDAIACGTRLYNAGLFYFGYPPHDLTPIKADWVFVMSQLDVGPESPQQRVAFDLVINATAKKYGDVLVRDTSGDLYNQGSVIPVTRPPNPLQNAPGISKLISGTNAADCASTLLDSGLIVSKDQTDGGYVKITSRPELSADNADQSRDFDLVVRATAEIYDDAKVSELLPELL